MGTEWGGVVGIGWGWWWALGGWGVVGVGRRASLTSKYKSVPTRASTLISNMHTSKTRTFVESTTAV